MDDDETRAKEIEQMGQTPDKTSEPIIDDQNDSEDVSAIHDNEASDGSVEQAMRRVENLAESLEKPTPKNNDQKSYQYHLQMTQSPDVQHEY